MLVLLGVAVVLAVGAAQGASAAVVGIERVGALSASDSANKSATVSCPAGKKVLGAEADVNPGNGDVLIDDVRPSADLQSVTVNALEDESGTSANWTVSALATCAFPPPGLERVSATSPLNSTNKSVAATCPSGKRVLGVGADLNTFVGQVLLDDMRPDAGLTNVTVNALEDETGNSTNWSVTAYAVCAAPVQGLTRVSATSPLDSTSNRVVRAPCPGGKQLTGAGGDINTFNGQVVLDATFSELDASGSGFAAFEDDTGNPASWSLTAYAICANSEQRVVAKSASNTVIKKFAQPTCATGQRLTGAGGELVGGFGSALIAGYLIPPEDPTTIADFQMVSSIGPAGGQANAWSETAYALCATPLPGLAAVQTATGGTTSSLRSSCPSPKKLVGTAGGVELAEGGTVPDGYVPASDLGSMTLTAISNNEVMEADAFCAIPPPGLQLVSATSPTTSEENGTSATAACPAGKHLTGTGARVNNGNNQVVIDDMRPNPALTSVTVSGFEDQDGYDQDWSVTAFAICVSY
jgi:hypothetical protein